MANEKMISYVDRQLRAARAAIDDALHANEERLAKVQKDLASLSATVKYMQEQKDQEDAADQGQAIPHAP